MPSGTWMRESSNLFALSPNNGSAIGASEHTARSLPAEGTYSALASLLFRAQFQCEHNDEGPETSNILRYNTWLREAGLRWGPGQANQTLMGVTVQT